MKKLKILILALAGVISFSVVFGITFFLKKSQPVLSEVAVEQAEEQSSDMFDMDQANFSETFKTSEDSSGYKLTKSMTEKQLKSLIFDIREKMKENKYSEKQLEKREQRMQLVRDTLQKDIDRLETLSTQLTSILTNLKQQEYNLSQTMLKISDIEKVNMQKIAVRYDKMTTEAASKIMINMISNDQVNDVVKIIYYMSERLSGKLLGEIGSTKPELAALISNQLKRVKESE